MNEHEAILRLKRGDIGGLEVLVHSYQVRAVRVAYLVCHDRALAEDIMQAAFLRAYERIDQFDASRPFAPWFLRSVINEAIRASQRHQRQEPLRGDDDETGPAHFSNDPDLADVVASDETSRAIWAMLKQLTPEQRAVIVQRYYLDMSEAEMATQAATPVGTIKSRLHYARQRLRQLLGGADSSDQLASSYLSQRPASKGDK